jgi:hypothetical protein
MIMKFIINKKIKLKKRLLNKKIKIQVFLLSKIQLKKIILILKSILNRMKYSNKLQIVKFNQIFQQK